MAVPTDSIATLYGVSVGPGDPGLLTLKAVRVIEACPVIAVPMTESGHERALEIVQGAVDLEGKRLLEVRFPMARDPEERERARTEAAARVADELDAGRDVAFITLGDASIWSTFTHMLERLRLSHRVEVVPGVPSFCAAAAALGRPLARAGEALHIIPGGGDGLDDALDMPGTKVLMKSGSALPKVVETLRERGLDRASGMVQLAGLPGEAVYPVLPQGDAYDKTYFTTIIVGGGA